MGFLLGLPTAAVLLVLQLLWAGSCPEVSGIGTTAGAAPGVREGLAGGVLQRGLAPGDGEGAACRVGDVSTLLQAKEDCRGGS